MIRTITALFDDTGEAESAMTTLSRAVPIMKAGIVTCGPGERPDFGAIYLSRTQREACEAELAGGGSLLIAQVEGDDNAEKAVDLLDRLGHQQAPEPARPPQPASAVAPAPASLAAAPTPIPAERVEGVPVSTLSRRAEPEAPPAPLPPARPQAATSEFEPRPEPASPAPAPAAVSEPEPTVEDEQHVPIVEEELRIGKRSVLRGGARVHSYVEEVPVVQDVELLEEQTHVERRPVNRRLSEEEIAASGVLQDRVVEITQMREEAVLSKEAYVREELVVKKTVEKRIEQVRDTVRRTAVEVERLEPELAGSSGEQRG